MAANDELFRILLEVVGKDGINDLKTALAATKDQAADLGEQYRRGEIGQQDYLRGVEALAREAANYQKTIVGLERSLDAQAKATENAGAAVLSLKNRLTEEEEAAENAGKGAAAAMGRIGAGGTDAAYKLQVLGGTLDDLQYVGEQGLRPILGNIMQISPAVGIALLAFDLMRKALNAFVGEAEDAGGAVERLKKRVEELEKNPHKIQLDIDSLNAADAKLREMEKRLAAFESARETAQAADLAKQAGDVVKNYGGSDAFMKSVLEMEKVAGVSHGEGADEVALRDKQTALASLLARTGGDENMNRNQRWAADALRRDIDELQAKIEQSNRDWAKQEVGAFASGDEAAIQRMQNRAARNPGAFATQGPRGIDAAEAVGGLPSTQREAQMRAEKDSADRRMEGYLREQRQEQARREKEAGDAAKKEGGRFIKDRIKDLQDWRQDTDEERKTRDQEDRQRQQEEDRQRRAADAEAKRKAADADRQKHRQAEYRAREEQRLGGPEALAIRDEIAGVIQQKTHAGLGDSAKAAEEAMRLAMQEGIDLQSATLAVMQQMAAQAQAQRQALARMRGQLGGIRGQMRAGQPQAPGSWNPYAFWQ